jgi:hypothetical protein
MAMTDRDKKVLAAVLGLLLLAGIWFLMIRPKQTAVSEAQTRKDQAQAALDAAKVDETAAKAVKREKPQSYARIVRLGAAVPVGPDFESLLVQINSIAEKSQVSFENLSVAMSNADSGATAAASGTTCQPAGATGATAGGSTGSTGSTAQTWVGSSINKANNAAGTANSTNAQRQTTTAELSCDAAPTLADLSAQAAGLTSYSYTLTFKGSYFKLEDVLERVLGLVKVKNGQVAVDGRLLDIKQMTFNIDEFPVLTANIQLTGYSMPVAEAATTQSASPSGTPASSTGPTP